MVGGAGYARYQFGSRRLRQVWACRPRGRDNRELVRALWIVPMSLAAAAVKGSKTKIQWPWFILFFCLAALANTYVLQKRLSTDF